MTDAIAILVPVLGRPGNVRPLLESIAEGTETPHRVLFLAQAGDKSEIRALKAVGADYVVRDFPMHGNFAHKINYGVTMTDEPWVFAGADDLRFHMNWDVIALSVASASRKSFIGTNDMGNRLVMRGLHSTHSLVARSYIEEYGTIDEPGKLYCELYDHNWTDNEAVETAKARHQWIFARRSLVEHLHPIWEKGPTDATYERGMAEFVQDRTLLARRRRLWSRNAMRRNFRRATV